MVFIFWTIAVFIVYYICYLLGKVLEPILKGFTLIVLIIIAVILLSLIAGVMDFSPYPLDDR
mgnify:FL=1|tara:strand:+ start:219 stop:404 length:186 start_codon:yes stop_codon:yes gene_type:complete